MDTIVYTRELPVRWDVDVAVIGGGMAGACAAIAAAQTGATVALVERFAVTGGMLTAGGVSNFCGETAGQGQVFDEIIANLDAFGAIWPYKPYEHRGGVRPFHYEFLSVILQEMLLKYGVRLLLHTRFVDVAASADGRIDALLLRGQSGPEALRARQFIDCTGEGELAHLAGCSTMVGRPDDNCLPMSLMYFVREVEGDDIRCEVPQGWVDHLRSADDLPMTSIWPNGPRANAIKIKVIGRSSTDTESLTDAETFARKRMLQVLDYHQRVDKKPWVLDHASPIIGIREGRRIVGDYILSEDDVRNGRTFEDGVAVGTFYLDAHDPKTDKRVDQILTFEEKCVPPYQIPLRSLIAHDAQNLWMAGRDMSGDLLAMSSARVTTSCAMMGQAAGIGAALAAQRKLSAHDLPAAEVRRLIVDRGANLNLGGRLTSLKSQ